MNRFVIALALALSACGGDDDKNDDECLKFDIIYDGDESLPLHVSLAEARGSGGSSWPSVEIARGMNERYWSCTSPASGGITTVVAWVDADRSCDLDDFDAVPCGPSAGDPFVMFDEVLGHGFHVVTLDFTTSGPYPEDNAL